MQPSLRTILQPPLTAHTMAAATSFGVPASHHPEAAIAGEVTIARVHLDAVPESLLSIAAQQSPGGEVVRLSSWHEPNVAVLKVVADCFMKSGQKREPVAPEDVLNALDYFIIPESLWPEGLIAMAAVGRKYDQEANQIMHTIKTDMKALAISMHAMNTKVVYCILSTSSQSNSSHGLVARQVPQASCYLSYLLWPLPPGLKERLQHIADDMFFKIEFNPEARKQYCEWSLTIEMHIPLSKRIIC